MHLLFESRIFAMEVSEHTELMFDAELPVTRNTEKLITLIVGSYILLDILQSSRNGTRAFFELS